MPKSPTPISSVPATFEQIMVFKECRRNYGVALGNFSLDGCLEFLKAGHEDGTKEALTCAACGCHRNFHRPEIIYTPIFHVNTFVNNVAPVPVPAPALAAIQQANHSGGGGQQAGGCGGGVRRTEPGLAPRIKRKKTMFTDEQKTRLAAFATRLGWKYQRHEHQAIEDFCEELGIERRVFMVWLRNNRRQIGDQNAGTSGGAAV
ncbi:Zinc-finger homeodomain protein [Quillaja saponaria]|uniref:Zinc-finger homeodomain protein n=1 Tax=Quillaja saponaria TaxID=32244 RepID=A0AAD7KVK2_QUISA|nr:Zinc-finger homeodomain protein [Quillaja saponaria]